MSCRKYQIALVVFCVAAFTTSTFAQSPHLASSTKGGKGLLILPFQVVDSDSPLIRAQDDQNIERKGPSFFQKMKRTIANWAKENDFHDDEYYDGSPQGKVQNSPNPTQQTSAVPTTPPKPVTANDIRKSIDQPESVSAKRTTATQRPAEPIRETPSKERDFSTSPQSSQSSDSAGTANSESIYDHMKKIREQVFTDGDSAPVAKTVPTTVGNSRMNPPTYSTRVASPQEQERTNDVVSPGPAERRPTQTGGPAYVYQSTPREQSTPSAETIERFQPTSRRLAVPSEPVGNPWESNDIAPIGTSSVAASGVMGPLSGVDVERKISNGSSWNHEPRETRGSRESREVVQRMEVREDTKATLRSDSSERDKALSSSPLIELETVGSSKVIVGQEAAYQIRVINRGGAAAEQVVLTVEIPHWIDVLPPDVSAGTTSIVSRGSNSDVRDFVWKIAKVDSRSEEQIVMHLVPKQRQTVDLKIKYDFRKPQAIAKMIVQEPTLEMELQGPSEVLWGSKVNYKLFVRNTGNGDAENVKLELLQTGSDMKSHEIQMLRAGEEQMIDVDVWTGKQNHIDINIQATGAYDLSANVLKRVIVMRPELSVRVESPEMQFVGNPTEFTIRVQNKGNATAKNVDLSAAIPLGAKYVSNTAGGRLTPQNQVVWNVDAIPGSGEFVATVVCEMKREGLCKLDAAVSDKSGVLASSFGNINVEAIADLKMLLENPQGPVEVGQEAVFVITVTNRGTKTAEDVEVVAAFARGLEPFGIEGGNGVMNDGQVVFDKIPAINAGQTLTLKVKGKADRPGNHRIRAEVICAAVNAHLVYEQATYFYQKGKTSVAESPSSAGFGATETPITPSPLSIQRNASQPQPLQSPPISATRSGSPLR